MTSHKISSVILNCVTELEAIVSKSLNLNETNAVAISVFVRDLASVTSVQITELYYVYTNSLF